jgi:hypothetical protein
MELSGLGLSLITFAERQLRFSSVVIVSC